MTVYKKLDLYSFRVFGSGYIIAANVIEVCDLLDKTRAFQTFMPEACAPRDGCTRAYREVLVASSGINVWMSPGL